MPVTQYADIFEFTKFRKFLAEYLENRLKAEPGFSRAEFCRQLGFPNTRSYINDVLRGKRVSDNMTSRFADVMGLDPKESEYFRAMVDFDQAEYADNRKTALEKMMAIHPKPETVLHSDDYEFFSKWYNSAVFAALDVLKIKDDYTELAERIFPKISLEKVTEAVNLLLKLGLIAKDAHDYLKPAKDRIASEEYDKSEFVKEYQRQSLDLSKLALDSSGKESRDMTAFAFSASAEAAGEIREEYKKFMKNVRKIVSGDTKKPEVVEQLNVHLFSLLKKED